LSPFRPDLVDTWMYRERARAGAGAGRGTEVAEIGAEAAPASPRAEAAAEPPAIEILLLRRAPGRILPGLWQCVSGSLEVGETITEGALRELREETGFGEAEIEAFYDLDQVNQFHEPSAGAILSSAVFAVRLHLGSEPVLSHEHDAATWATPDEALEIAVWPAYRESIRRIAENLPRPDRAPWFELTLDGRRARV
jgi:8-oxo-dGTP pyrophosphatase MutT (NUDIX family)